jgi:hypothetical protein
MPWGRKGYGGNPQFESPYIHVLNLHLLLEGVMLFVTSLQIPRIPFLPNSCYSNASGNVSHADISVRKFPYPRHEAPWLSEQFGFTWHMNCQSLSQTAAFCGFRNRSYIAYYITLSRMASSGMLRRVALVRTDVSEELSASFIRVTRIGELGTTLAVTSNRRTLRRNTENLKSYITLSVD